ncbi:polysaccharide deacetylase [Bacillus thermotolerans]|uniref:Polysaccharide deacetylase n=2 Tax=Bacillus thermotolerans TaxID=1221996 RepID=A0A0F5I9U9_BACTR|nr:polysaccharide deacetylase [Bacillus thermotolerans]KKB42213.1 polysaccharide deacetylase [Bacillus thermotolerans]
MKPNTGREGILMRKWLGILTLSIALAGCGENAAEAPEESQQTPPIPEEQANSEQAEEKVSEEAKGTPAETPPLYRINEQLWTIEPLQDANPKVALLTIDDAPENYSLEMAKTLKEYEVPAIFFVNGMFLEEEESRQILKEIAHMGFEIGNHTYSHQNLKSLTEKEQREEILKVNRMVEEITGEKPIFFRAPFGSNTDFSRKIVQEENMVLMNWTYGYDWEEEYMDEAPLANIMVNTPLLQNGANLLMHDRKWTNEALDDIITGLRQKGYEFVDPAVIKNEQQTET